MFDPVWRSLTNCRIVSLVDSPTEMNPSLPRPPVLIVGATSPRMHTSTIVATATSPKSVSIHSHSTSPAIASPRSIGSTQHTASPRSIAAMANPASPRSLSSNRTRTPLIAPTSSTTPEKKLDAIDALEALTLGPSLGAPSSLLASASMPLDPLSVPAAGDEQFVLTHINSSSLLSTTGSSALPPRMPVRVPTLPLSIEEPDAHSIPIQSPIAIGVGLSPRISVPLQAPSASPRPRGSISSQSTGGVGGLVAAEEDDPTTERWRSESHARHRSTSSLGETRTEEVDEDESPLPDLPPLPPPLALRLDFSDLRAFVHSPLPRWCQLKCTLHRDKSTSFSARFYPTYTLTYDPPYDPSLQVQPDRIVLAYAQKKSSNRYLLRLAEQDAIPPASASTSTTAGSHTVTPSPGPGKIKETDIGYLGMLRANFVGNKYSFVGPSATQGKGTAASGGTIGGSTLLPPRPCPSPPLSSRADRCQLPSHYHTISSTAQSSGPSGSASASPAPSPPATPSSSVPSSPAHRAMRAGSFSGAGTGDDTANGSATVLVDMEYEINIFNQKPRHLTVTLPGLREDGESTSLVRVSSTPEPFMLPPAVSTDAIPTAVASSPSSTTANSGPYSAAIMQQQPRLSLSTHQPIVPPPPIFLHTNQPRWNAQREVYLLNFHGRAPVPSMKNFQLIVAEQQFDLQDASAIVTHSTNPDGTPAASPRFDGARKSSSADTSLVVLQLGKKSPNDYNVDLSYPLSPLQAFAIVMSAFDFKLAVD